MTSQEKSIKAVKPRARRTITPATLLGHVNDVIVEGSLASGSVVDLQDYLKEQVVEEAMKG